jgi:hypothetical protein
MLKRAGSLSGLVTLPNSIRLLLRIVSHAPYADKQNQYPSEDA